MSVINPDKSIPRHIGIIMDGNGRWAKQQGLSRIKGHRQGAETTRSIIDACQDIGIEHLTLYAFSAENWNRPETEVNALMELLEFFIEKELKTLSKKNVRLRAIGRIDELPNRTRKALKSAIEKTKNNDSWNLTLALNYSSRDEVIDAVKAFSTAAVKGTRKIENLDWERFSKYLYTKDIPDPDLIIRTSGETRLSNFLLMQSAYSEFYFTQTHWPDFTKTHLEEAVASYQRRERRFGLTGEQIEKTPAST
ncbi:isoprenyl transferase [Puniceicoccaceae bacterium K14]|nr:isoprenyl transferase [Puniceicoccaceae bacterium K14]